MSSIHPLPKYFFGVSGYLARLDNFSHLQVCEQGRVGLQDASQESNSHSWDCEEEREETPTD